MSRIETIDYAAAVDELAELKAAIAPLQERETAIKELLKATGRERIDGTAHTAVITLSERETVNTKALRADLGEAIMAPYLSRSIVETLKLTARKTH
jgi:type II secretory pathway component PulM